MAYDTDNDCRRYSNMSNRAIHYVGFRGDEYVRAHRIWGGPVIIHKDYDDRVMTEVGDEDVVIFGPKYKKTKWAWDASASC